MMISCFILIAPSLLRSAASSCSASKPLWKPEKSSPSQTLQLQGMSSHFWLFTLTSTTVVENMALAHHSRHILFTCKNVTVCALIISRSGLILARTCNNLRRYIKISLILLLMLQLISKHLYVHCSLFLSAVILQLTQVEHNLKEECQILQASLECLPTSTSHDISPWSSIVVNFNCTTLAHKDLKDQLLCGVLVIGDCKGGDLCFYEPGLVLPLRSGDFVAFYSSKITHFNLDFVGIRISIVFHSDSNIQSWVHNRNGWIKNAFYR